MVLVVYGCPPRRHKTRTVSTLMEYIYLTGSEDVQEAGFVMRDAAAEMTRAANQIWDAMGRFREEIDRLEQLSIAEDTDA